MNMKVFCIISTGWVQIANFDPKRGNSGPEYGDIDEVVAECVFEELVYYQLERFPGDDFYSGAFIPISDMDETTFERQQLKKETHWPVDKSIKHLI